MARGLFERCDNGISSRRATPCDVIQEEIRDALSRDEMKKIAVRKYTGDPSRVRA
jgi:hypothetical protein